MDNKQFNVNGGTKDMLRATLQLALVQENEKSDPSHQKAKGYVFDQKHGLILLWSVDVNKGESAFIAPLGADALTEMIWEWLKSDQAKSVPLLDWDADIDQDGHNSRGWRVYCGNWGHIGSIQYAITAIQPAMLWHGK